MLLKKVPDTVPAIDWSLEYNLVEIVQNELIIAMLIVVVANDQQVQFVVFLQKKLIP